MKHLFKNDDGEVVAADTAEQASTLCDGPWCQITDMEMVPEPDERDGNWTNAKSAAEWAEQFAEPAYFSTTYV